MSEYPTRRLLAGLAVVAGSLGVAGCGSGEATKVVSPNASVAASQAPKSLGCGSAEVIPDKHKVGRYTFNIQALAASNLALKATIDFGDKPDDSDQKSQLIDNNTVSLTYTYKRFGTYEVDIYIYPADPGTFDPSNPSCVADLSLTAADTENA